MRRGSAPELGAAVRDDNERLMNVVVAPFANERIKEWPSDHFRRLIELIIDKDGFRVIIVGTRSQRARADRLVRGFSAVRVINTCGQIKWSEVIAVVSSAACVVANNSGIAHLAAMHGRWTLCIFGGAHQWLEWIPRGPRVVLITRMTRCAPCEIGDKLCPNEIVCMSDLTPEAVYKSFLDIRSQVAEEIANGSSRDEDPAAECELRS